MMDNEDKKKVEQVKEIKKDELTEIPNQDLEIKGGNLLARIFRSIVLLFPFFNPSRKVNKLVNGQKDTLDSARWQEEQVEIAINKEMIALTTEISILQKKRRKLEIKRYKWFIGKMIGKDNLKAINKRLRYLEETRNAFVQAKKALETFKAEKMNSSKVNDIEGDLLLLIRQSEVEIYNDIKTGIFELDEDHHIRIDPKKRLIMKIGGEKVGVFIGYENSYTLFPQEPVHDSYVISSDIKVLTNTLKDFANLRQGMKAWEGVLKWVAIIVLGALVIYVVALMMGIDILHPKVEQNTTSCWIKNDMNEWLYMCGVPDANGNMIDLNSGINRNALISGDGNVGYRIVNGQVIYDKPTGVTSR